MDLYPQDIHHSGKKKNLGKLGSSGWILVRVSMINKTLTRNNSGDKGHVWLMGYGLSCREIRVGVQDGNPEQRTWRKVAACHKATHCSGLLRFLSYRSQDQ